MNRVLTALFGISLIAAASAATFWMATPASAQPESTVRLFTGGSRVSRPAMVVDYTNILMTVRLHQPMAVGDKRENANVLHNVNATVSVSIRRRDGREDGLAEAAEVAGGLEPIIRSDVIGAIKPGTVFADQALSGLPDRVRATAEASFRKEFSGWENSHQFDTEILVTDFHATDMSVGSR